MLGQAPSFEVTVTEELSLVLILHIVEIGEVNSTFEPGLFCNFITTSI